MALLSQPLPSQPRSRPFSQAKRRTPLVQPLFHTTGIKRHGLSICLASSNPSYSMSSNLVELPIFPLPLVLFPGATLPLQIFEFRYRIMMRTLLQTDLRFGVLFSNLMPSSTDPSSALVEVGCVAEVVKHQRLVDDRFFLICKGQVRDYISFVGKAELKFGLQFE
jgi:ATP-dependent protease La (LON) substrate-binding domain